MKLGARDIFDPRVNFWEQGTLVRPLTAEEGRAIISAYRILKGEFGQFRVQHEMDMQRAATQYGNMLQLICDLTNTGKGREATRKRIEARQQAKELLIYHDQYNE